jgi:hypothetical protein
VPCELPRRALLTGAGALAAAALTGCTGAGREDREELRAEAERAERSPAARRLRRATERDSAALLAHYDAVLTAHPALRGALAELRETVAAQLTVLRAESGRPAGGAAGPKAPGEIDADAGAAVAALAAAERETADGRLAALAQAPPELARLLASLAAAGTTQEYLLTEVAR